ncbi:transposase-like protein [Paraburkholderia sp. GAS333]
MGDWRQKVKQYFLEQIVAALKRAESNMPVADLIRQLGISDQTYYRWKRLYAGLESHQVRELAQFDDENARLKKLVAKLSLDKAILQGIAIKKAAPRALIKGRSDLHHGLIRSFDAAGALSGQTGVQHHYGRIFEDPQTALRQRTREIPQTRERYGYRRVRVLLKREGCRVS